MTDIDTSAEAVNRSCNQADLGQLSDQNLSDISRTLLAERDALAASCDEWMKALGAVLGALPLSEIVHAGASVGETITAVKARFETVTSLETEVISLRKQLAEARNAALEDTISRMRDNWNWKDVDWFEDMGNDLRELESGND